MKTGTRIWLFLAILVVTVQTIAAEGEHPRLIMTKAGVQQIRAELGAVPLFDATLKSVKAEVDAEIEL